ncbi:MAG: ATP-binding protein [Defluviitaleaceae bacterium]|nr:ATP-binding protein [Defluviitaleaceae bacterium]
MKNNRILSYFIFSLTAFFSVAYFGAPAVYPNDTAPNHLVIAAPNNEPISTNRLLYAALRSLGYSVDFVSPIIREGYTQANEGFIDGLTTGYPDLHHTYTGLIQLPIAIENTNVRVFAREGSTLSVNTWAELDGLTVGILENRTFIPENIPEGATVIERPTERAVLNGLENGDYDVAVLAERDHENIGERYNITIIGQVHTLPIHIYLNEKHAALAPRLNGALERMFADGSASRILSDLALPELNPRQTVLHIISSSVELSREDQFSEALRSRFEDDESVEWITVNIDANRFTRGEHTMAHIASLLRADIVSRNIAAVIVSGDPALEFLKDYYYLFFRNTPVLFYGISEESHATIAEHYQQYNFTGIVKTIAAYETVNAFLDLFPDTLTLFVVNDFTPEGLQYRHSIESQLRPLASRLNIYYSENIEAPALMERIGALPHNSLVLVGSYFVDGAHQYFSLGETRRLLGRHANVPIASFYCTTIAYNAVGGLHMDYVQYGFIIADMLRRILDGHNVEDIPIIYDSGAFNRWVFDQAQLDAFGIRAKDLPVGAEVINRIPGIREANPQFFFALVSAMAVTALLIIGSGVFLLINRRHNKQKDGLKQALTVEKSLMEIIFDSVPEILFVKDLDNFFLRVNKKFEEHFGCDEGDIIGKRGYEYPSLAAVVHDYLETELTIVTENRPISVEKYITDAKGETGFYEIIAAPMRDGNKKVLGIAGVAYNMTHRKKAEEAAQAASTAKSNFLTNMSHEIRTPLTAVLGLTELTLETVPLDDDTHTNLVKVFRSGETILNLINDILDISKIEADKLELNPRKYDVADLLNDAITQSILYIGEKPIEPVLDIGPDLPRYLYGDELRIKQLLSNLLSNAFKFTKEGTVELGIRCERKKGDVWLTAWVKDTGAGIKPEDIGKLFTLYGRLEEDETNGRDRRTEGSGLGLSISKKVTEMMGGNITAESEYGKGSTFTVYLRQGFVDDTVIGPEVAESLKQNSYYAVQRFESAKMSRINLSYARVLLVDDNPTNLDVAKGLMGLYGITADCVTSGRQAIEAMSNPDIKYHAVFMDHMMPEMDGITAVRHIRAIDSDYARFVPIIALTANAIVGNEEMFLFKGFTDFIPKPIDLARLDHVLRRWVRNRDEEMKLPRRIITAEIRRGKDKQRLPAIPGLDIAKGIAHFGYSEEAYIKVLQSFVRNTRPLLEIIKTVARDNLDVYAVTIHGIKGSAYGIFASEVGDLAAALEKAALVHNLYYVSENNPAFIGLITTLLSDIHSALSGGIVVDKPAKEKPDAALLKRLAAACAVFDIDGMDEAMDDIEGYTYTNDGGLIERLREKLDQGKYKNIKDELTAFIPDTEV